MKNVYQKLQRLHLTRYREINIAPAFFLAGNLETQTDHGFYQWDGLRRGGDPEHPYLLFQCTLDGCGQYTDPQGIQKLAPGSAFVVPIPSAHHYGLPRESSSWTFFYIMTSHGYVAERIRDRQDNRGRVLQLDEDSPLIIRAVQILEGLAPGGFTDDFAREQALFEFMLEYERTLHRQSYPENRREGLLEDVRSYTLRHLNSPFDISGLAEQTGLSRSNFSHRFKAVTGLSPAFYVQQVRLEEATHRLINSDLKLEAIADQTGFADANHFCKVFRRRFHLSPGEFRRQMR
jgi:AraC-like DNA-binding protein